MLVEHAPREIGARLGHLGRQQLLFLGEVGPAGPEQEGEEAGHDLCYVLFRRAPQPQRMLEGDVWSRDNGAGSAVRFTPV